MVKSIDYCDVCMKNQKETIATVKTKTFVGYNDQTDPFTELWADIELCSYHAGKLLLEMEKKLSDTDRRYFSGEMGYSGMYF